MKKRILIILIVISILTVSFLITKGLINSKPLPSIAEVKELVINVKEYVVKNTEYTIDINYTARVYAKDIVNLGVQVSGQILPGDIPLKSGQHFQKGDLLVNIYDKDIEANLKSMKSQFLNSLAKALPDIKIDFSNEFDKWASFFDEIELDKPLPKLPKMQTTKEKVYLSAKGIVSNYYSIEQTEIILDRYKIYAPFDGVLKNISKEVGSIASMGSDIGVITSTNNLELIMGVSALESTLLSIGKKVEIKSSSDKKYIGEIVRISPSVDQRTQRVLVYISLHEPSMDIIDGQMVDVNATLNPLENVTRIPREVINKYNQIYKITDNRLYPIDITSLINVGKYSYIKGVKDGTSIIYESLVEPKIGTKVNVIEKIVNE